MHSREDIVVWLADRVSKTTHLLEGSVRIDEAASWAPIIYASERMRGVNGAASAALFQNWADDRTRDSRRTLLSHDLLQFAVSGPNDDISLATGWSGIGVVAKIIAGDTSAYQQVRSRIAELANEIIGPTIERDAITTSKQYELLWGYAGIFLCLDREYGEVASRVLVDFFDWLTVPDKKRWDLPHGDPAGGTARMMRLGVSHGIAGVLGSLCCRFEVPGAEEIIRRLVAELINLAEETPYGPQWAYATNQRLRMTNGFLPMAWCHFSLGIAAVLAGAGVLLNDIAITSFAEESVLGLIRLPASASAARDASLCHGAAGNAVLLRYIGDITGNSFILTASRTFERVAIDFFNPEFAFGFQAVMEGGRRESDCTFLVGASGIGLALASLTDKPRLEWLELLGVPPRAHGIAIARRYGEAQ